MEELKKIGKSPVFKGFLIVAAIIFVLLIGANIGLAFSHQGENRAYFSNQENYRSSKGSFEHGCSNQTRQTTCGQAASGNCGLNELNRPIPQGRGINQGAAAVTPASEATVAPTIQ